MVVEVGTRKIRRRSFLQRDAFNNLAYEENCIHIYVLNPVHTDLSTADLIIFTTSYPNQDIHPTLSSLQGVTIYLYALRVRVSIEIKSVRRTTAFILSFDNILCQLFLLFSPPPSFTPVRERLYFYSEL